MKKLSCQGASIPALGLGTWKAKKGEVYGAVREALHAGYTHIDCAPAYENEVEVGAAVREMVVSGKVKRESLWITSKLWNNAHRPEDVEAALKSTLTDLQLDYLDLYLIHWPVAFSPGVFFPRSGEDYLSLDDVPIIETWQAMGECVDRGLVSKIGVCNFSRKRLKSLLQTGVAPPFMNQIELHPYLQQPDMLQFCSQNDILLTAYSPLGSPDRPARLKKKQEPTLLDNTVLKEIASRLSLSVAQLLIAWALNRGTAVIPKSVNPERIRENLEAGNIVLSKEDMERIASLDLGFRYVDGTFWETPGSGYSASEIWEE